MNFSTASKNGINLELYFTAARSGVLDFFSRTLEFKDYSFRSCGDLFDQLPEYKRINTVRF